MDSTKIKIAYTTTERNGRTFWNRIGVAFLNKDGSINVRLESLPVTGELHIRDLMSNRDTHDSPTVSEIPAVVDAAAYS